MSSFSRTLLTWITLFLISLPVYCNALEETTRDTLAMGSAKISEGNVASAKKLALSRGLQKGVEGFLVNRLGGQGAVNNFERLVLEVLPKAEELIENFIIISEYQSGESINLLVRLRIDETLMEERFRMAGLLVNEGAPLKVLFMVSEIREGVPSFWWEEPEASRIMGSTEIILQNVFRERGFEPINWLQDIPGSDIPEEVRVLEPENTSIAKLGRLYGADLVIHGKNRISSDSVGLTVSVIGAGDGLFMGGGTYFVDLEEGITSQDHQMEILKKLAVSFADDVTPEILSKTAETQEKINSLTVSLEGLSSFKELLVFRDFLKNSVKGVASVKQKRVKRGSASLDVEFKGKRELFVSRVMNHEDLPLPLMEGKGDGEGVMFLIENIR